MTRQSSYIMGSVLMALLISSSVASAQVDTQKLASTDGPATIAQAEFALKIWLKGSVIDTLQVPVVFDWKALEFHPCLRLVNCEKTRRKNNDLLIAIESALAPLNEVLIVFLARQADLAHVQFNAKELGTFRNWLPFSVVRVGASAWQSWLAPSVDSSAWTLWIDLVNAPMQGPDGVDPYRLEVLKARYFDHLKKMAAINYELQVTAEKRTSSIPVGVSLLETEREIGRRTQEGYLARHHVPIVYDWDALEYPECEYPRNQTTCPRMREPIIEALVELIGRVDRGIEIFIAQDKDFFALPAGNPPETPRTLPFDMIWIGSTENSAKTASWCGLNTVRDKSGTTRILRVDMAEDGHSLENYVALTSEKLAQCLREKATEYYYSR